MTMYSNQIGHPVVDTMIGPAKKKKEADKFESREAKKRFTESSLPRAYKEASGKSFQKSSPGLVRLAMGPSPYDWDISLNPTVEEKEALRILRTEKLTKEPYYYEIYQYWWTGTRMVPLLGNFDVLSEERSLEAVKKLAKILEKATPQYLGEFFLSLSDKFVRRPCRVFAGQRLILVIDLTNGNIFILDDLPKEMIATGDKFFYKGVTYRKTEKRSFRIL